MEGLGDGVGVGGVLRPNAALLVVHPQQQRLPQLLPLLARLRLCAELNVNLFKMLASISAWNWLGITKKLINKQIQPTTGRPCYISGACTLLKVLEACMIFQDAIRTLQS